MQFWTTRGESIRRAPAPADVVGVSSRHLTPITVVLSIMVAGIWLQLSTYPNHDVAWVLWGAREILHGAKFGRGIIEPNPPLAWYLSLPTTALAEWIHVPLDWTFRVAVAIAGACSAASLAWLAARERSELGVACLCGIAGLALLILPGREFGQREHLLMIAILPYLALCAGWLSGREPASARVRLGLGIIAGLGVALKPYFLAAPALTELGLLLLGSRRPAIFRAENLGIATVCLAYLLWIATFERAYALEAAPLAGSIYWSFNLPLSAILPALLTQAAVATPFAGIALLKRDALGAITGFAWLGLAASYLVQQKGYGYHLLPVIIANLLLIASVLTNGTLDGKVRVAASTVAVVFAFTCAAPLRNWWVINKPGGQRSHEIDRILASIDREARNGRFLAVSVHPYPSFPAAIYTSARYTSRTNSEWFLPAVAQIRLNGATGHDTAAIERHAREFILHDLGARPNLVLIDTNSARHTVSSRRFDILAFYEEDPRFRSLWSSYREIERIGDYRQFVLVEGQLPPVRAIG